MNKVNEIKKFFKLVNVIGNIRITLSDWKDKERYLSLDGTEFETHWLKDLKFRGYRRSGQPEIHDILTNGKMLWKRWENPVSISDLADSLIDMIPIRDSDISEMYYLMDELKIKTKGLK